MKANLTKRLPNKTYIAYIKSLHDGQNTSGLQKYRK